jgi:hypothetical protein
LIEGTVSYLVVGNRRLFRFVEIIKPAVRHINKVTPAKSNLLRMCQQQ